MEITKKITLDLKGIQNKAQAKKDVGEFVVNEILRNLSEGKSPVSGERFKKLSKEYADQFKGGDRKPNLELEGDMLDALTFKNRADGIEVGVFKKKELGKADGHNNFSGDSKLPKRRFIPDEGQDFKANINKGIKQILAEYREPPTEPTDFGSEPTEPSAGFSLDDLLQQDFDSFLAGALNG